MITAYRCIRISFFAQNNFERTKFTKTPFEPGINVHYITQCVSQSQKHQWLKNTQQKKA